MTTYRIEVESIEDDENRSDTMYTIDEDEAETIYQELTEDPATLWAQLSYIKTSGGIAYDGGKLREGKRTAEGWHER